MFPTFSGNSRRPRNVNLSGQKNSNPFAATSWGTGSATGASKTVADAAAERQQRQQERKRRQAVHDIQRVWRGHRVRRDLRAAYRAEFDDIYSSESMLDVGDRIRQAFPLLLSVFDASQPADLDRLAQLGQDLLQTSLTSLDSGQIDPARLNKLSRAVIRALDVDSRHSHRHSLVYLKLLNAITHSRPEAVEDVLGAYYSVVGQCCRCLTEDAHLPEIVQAVIGPLGSQRTAILAYHELVASFLVQPDLSFFEKSIHLFSNNIDIAKLSDAVVTYYSGNGSVATGQDNGLWLLAHFIALLRANPAGSLHSINLKALYIQLSALSSQIRIGFASSGEEAATESTDGLPQYVHDQLSSLVRKEGISDLLERFTLNHSGDIGQDFEDASLLAAYTLTIIRSFPAHGDDIRMRLFLADIQTPSGRLPAVKFFWKAMRNTSIFSVIMSSEDATLDLLRRGRLQTGSSSRHGSKWDQEWRSVLLFLELYVFVLRLTDDDDFFSGLGTAMNHNAAPPSRLRQSCLPSDDLKGLTLFLKHLGFTLLYNAAQLHESDSAKSQPSGGLGNFLAETFSVISGIDFGTFRSIVTTAMRMLYERDSRRRFLPEGHWLMTSKFNMESFLQAVVLEEERQHELREQEEDGEDGRIVDVDEDEPMEDEGYRSMSQAGLQRSRNARLELLRKQQRIANKERMLAAIGPKLEILRKMPFVIPFETRVQIFRQFVGLDKHRRRGGHIDPDRWRLWVMSQTSDPFDPRTRPNHPLARHEAKVKRGQVFQDALKEFYQLGDGLKEPIQITFVDQFDTVEAGIDGGGVTKEFLMSVTKEAFTDQHSLMVANNKNAFYPNPCALDQRLEVLRQAGVRKGSAEWHESVNELLREYEFLGRIVGKCLYEGILIDIVFAPFFLLKWATSGSETAYRANINDLREMDDELYQGMLNLKNYPGDVSELGLDFTINDQISYPGEPVRTVTRNLVPDGENMLVTNENRPLYISYVARHRLAVQPHAQTKAFLRGLGSIIDPGWLSMFNQNELQRLVGGDSSEIDVEDLRANTQYSGVYQIGDDGQEHPTVQMFWEVMHGLEDHERRDVLKYVTSTPRAPLLGFSQLRPQFTIRDGGSDQERLPSASTCVNLLKLPQYQSAKTLKSKLLYAVTSGAGFDLS
ncbi:hypothetical protein CONLIGDRAFT_582880 [Coniochaeta ligniaria NRRL 30616]|uniref:HECT-type E3 ubiquitin transferase n=1 Tax=Coniochaeta ligniaria NRRL 30616 TaxID=1408157 RepID=A0A1J7IBJ8_9PEZI|nr:hypothetical protein CONLIGDRAFT_582880 [Coniochaeta ligniaria NRRL 30616]